MTCATLLCAAGALPVFASISHHWDNSITFNSVAKPAFEHILDVVAGVDVQTAQDTAAVINSIAAAEIAYGAAIVKPVLITIETYDVVAHLSLSAFNTFFEEGVTAMQAELQSVSFTADPTPGFA